jgi:hypothetical protein
MTTAPVPGRAGDRRVVGGWDRSQVASPDDVPCARDSAAAMSSVRRFVAFTLASSAAAMAKRRRRGGWLSLDLDYPWYRPLVCAVVTVTRGGVALRRWVTGTPSWGELIAPRPRRPRRPALRGCHRGALASWRDSERRRCGLRRARDAASSGDDLVTVPGVVALAELGLALHEESTAIRVLAVGYGDRPAHVLEQ